MFAFMYITFWIFFAIIGFSCIAFGIYTTWKFRNVPTGGGGPGIGYSKDCYPHIPRM